MRRALTCWTAIWAPGWGWGGRGRVTPPSYMAQDMLSCRVTLSPRQGLPRIPLRGIFQGAKVVRGPDWEWGSQDGELGESGREGQGWAGVGCGCSWCRGLSLPAGPLLLQEGKGSPAEWWTFVAGMWRQAGVWPA